MRCFFLFLLISLPLVLMSTHQAAAGNFNVCNRGDNNLVVVKVEGNWGLLSPEGYTASGHYQLPPGNCVSTYLANYQWAYYGVYDNDGLNKLKELFDGNYDQRIFKKLKDEHKKTIMNLLFPYRPKSNHPIPSICAHTSDAFEYARTKKSDFSAECKEGEFRVLIVTISRGGDNDATMNLN